MVDRRRLTVWIVIAAAPLLLAGAGAIVAASSSQSEELLRLREADGELARLGAEAHHLEQTYTEGWQPDHAVGAQQSAFAARVARAEIAVALAESSRNRGALFIAGLSLLVSAFGVSFAILAAAGSGSPWAARINYREHDC